MSEKQNKMATWPIGKLLLSMGLPAVFSMLIQALYNVVDTIYVSSYSKDAMFAIGLANPLQMVGLSIALGGGVGAATLISRRMGQGRMEDANKVASNGFILTIIHTLITIAIGILFSKSFIALFTDRADIIEYGATYLRIVLIVCMGQQFSVFYERLFQAQGNMLAPMIAQLIGAIINIVLDPILIFGYLGFEAMGVAGAAIATVFAQICSMCFLFVYSLIKKPLVGVYFKYMKLNSSIVGGIYQVGLPAMVMNMISSVTTTALNKIIVKFSEDAVTSLSIYFKLQSFILMPIFGFNQGALPILSFNYGANDKKRYLDTIKIFVTIAECIMIFGVFLFAVVPQVPLSFFNTDESLLETAEMVLRTISLSFIFVGPNIVITTCLQSFGMGTTSMIQSIMRQVGILIPAAWLLSKISLHAVFYAYPISEIIMLLVFLPIAVNAYKRNFAVASK